MSRIYERDTDAVFLRNLRQDVKFAHYLLKCVGCTKARPESVHGQTRHIGSGTIDLEIRYSSGVTLLIENKIDAGYSVSGLGIGQPERYRETVRARRDDGEAAASVLLAPRRYLTRSHSAALFDHCIAYEQLIPLLADGDREIIELAIEQAGRPYEPVKDPHGSDFFQEYRRLVEERFPHLSMKKDPNANGVRPADSRTIYFDTKKTLNLHLGLPTLRMSLQCWDSSEPSASVKIMIGGWGHFARRMLPPSSLADIGGYLRPAGRSLAIVIDTPRLDTQRPLFGQIEAVVEGLEAALRLQSWWNANHRVLLGLQGIARQQAIKAARASNGGTHKDG